MSFHIKFKKISMNIDFILFFFFTCVRTYNAPDCKRQYIKLGISMDADRPKLTQW